MQIMIIFVNEEGSVIMPETSLYHFLIAPFGRCVLEHEEGKLPPPLIGHVILL